MSTAADPVMREIVTEPSLLLRFGPLPVVQLPQDNVPLIGFVQQMAAELKDKGFYRRDRVIMVPYDEQRELIKLDPKDFCTRSQHYVLTAKTKYDRNGNPYSVIKDMPTEVAEKTLLAEDFILEIPKIDEIHPAPLPVIHEGKMVLMTEGYHEPTRSLTFPLA